jgi:O-antigen/teichoic acid export membrane protein
MFNGIRRRLAGSMLAKRLLSGAVWNVGGSILTSAIGVMVAMITARVVGQSDYGRFVLIQTTLSTAGILAGFGIGATATRYVASLRSQNIARLARILGLTLLTVLFFGLLIAAALFLAARPIAAAALGDSSLTLPLKLAATAVFFSVLDGYHKSVLMGLEAMRAMSVGALLATGIGAPIILALVITSGLNGAALGLCAGALLQCTVSGLQLMRCLKSSALYISMRACMSEWPVLWGFALPALISSCFVIPVHWGVQVLVAHSRNGFAEVALLGVAMQWFSVATFVPTVAGRVLLPVLAERLSEGHKRHARQVLLLAIGASVAVAAPTALAISFASPWIMVAYGIHSEGSWLVLTLVSWVTVLVVAAMPVGHLISALGQMWLGAAMNFGWAIVYLGASLLAVPHGALGIVVALGIAYSVHTIWVSWFAVSQLSEAKPSIAS